MCEELQMLLVAGNVALSMHESLQKCFLIDALKPVLIRASLG